MKNRLMKNRLPLIAWAALPLTLGLAFAAQTQRAQPVQPSQTQQGQNLGQPGVPQNQTSQRPAAPQSSGTNYADVFLQKLAAQLGISVDKLKAAAIAAGSATIDQGVKAGDFPSDHAAEMKARLNDNPFAFGGRGPGGRGMHEHGRGGPDADGHGPGGGSPSGGKDRMDRGPRGMGQSDPQNNTNAQGSNQNSNFTF